MLRSRHVHRAAAAASTAPRGRPCPTARGSLAAPPRRPRSCRPLSCSFRPTIRRVGAEGVLPEVVAEHDDEALQRVRVLLGEKEAAEGRARGRAPEVLVVDQLARQPQGVGRPCSRLKARLPHTDMPENAVLRSRQSAISICESGQVATSALVARLPWRITSRVRLPVGQLAQQDGIDHREDRGRGADAERQREDRGERKNPFRPPVAATPNASPARVFPCRFLFLVCVMDASSCRVGLHTPPIRVLYRGQT